MDYLTICTEGSYLGKSKCERYDLFRFNNSVFRVNRETADVTQLPESLVEYFLDGESLESVA